MLLQVMNRLIEKCVKECVSLKTYEEMLGFYDNRNTNKFHLDYFKAIRPAKIKASDNGVVEVLTINFTHMALGKCNFCGERLGH